MRKNEFWLIRRLTAGLPTRKGRLRRGIGDDCAVIATGGQWDLLATTDMLLEGVHFRLDWSTLKEIGRKSLLVNLSDIAAMGGIPRYAVVAVGLPRHLKLRQIDSFFDGFKEGARESGALIVGGDTNRSQKLVISVTLIGEVEKGRALLRSGARRGDEIYVTGLLGEAAEALARHRGHEPPQRVLVGRYLVKRRVAHACIDLSDGLLSDLGHILDASGVGADLFIDRLPGQAPQRMKLAGGEDYELLFTVPPRVKLPPKIHGVRTTCIGKITGHKGKIRLINDEGKLVPLPRRLGFSHF